MPGPDGIYRFFDTEQLIFEAGCINIDPPTGPDQRLKPLDFREADIEQNDGPRWVDRKETFQFSQIDGPGLDQVIEAFIFHAQGQKERQAPFPHEIEQDTNLWIQKTIAMVAGIDADTVDLVMLDSELDILAGLVQRVDRLDLPVSAAFNLFI